MARKKNKNKIYIILTCVFLAILIFLSTIFVMDTQSLYNVAELESVPLFTDGVSEWISADYRGWDGERIKIFIGSGGLGSANPVNIVAPKKLQLLYSLKANNVQSGSDCEVKVNTIGTCYDGCVEYDETGKCVYHHSGCSGIPEGLYPYPRDTILTGTLQRIQAEDDFNVRSLTTSGGQQFYGYHEFDCVLDKPYPILIGAEQVEADSFGIRVRMLSDDLDNQFDCYKDDDCTKVEYCKIQADEEGGYCVNKPTCDEGYDLVDGECVKKQDNWLVTTIGVILFLLILMIVFLAKASKKKRRK